MNQLKRHATVITITFIGLLLIALLGMGAFISLKLGSPLNFSTATADAKIQSIVGLIGSAVTGLAALLALAAAYLTITEVRRQTELPIKTADRDRLLTQIANLSALQSELVITMEGLNRLKDGSIACQQDAAMARTYMPFWLHFPKVFDLRETTIAEIGVDFGLGGAREITRVRELLRMALRINYSIPRDAVTEYASTHELNRVLNDLSRVCTTALLACRIFNTKLTELQSITGVKLQRAEEQLQKLTNKPLISLHS